MRTKATPWNRSYKPDLARELKRQRPRGAARSKAQQAAKAEAQKYFSLHQEPKTPQELPEDWKVLGKNRKRAMEKVEDRRLAEELREVWE